MSKLQLNTKEFSGYDIGGRYRVLPDTDGVNISLTLTVTFRGKEVDAEKITTAGVDFLFESFEDKMNYVLQEAETQWGLKLSKAIMKKSA